MPACESSEEKWSGSGPSSEPRPTATSPMPADASQNPGARSAVRSEPNRAGVRGAPSAATAAAPARTRPRWSRNGPRMPPIAPSDGPRMLPTEYAARIPVKRRYSSPGKRSRTANVIPIQSPPAPMPCRSRDGK